jgi:glycerol-3-phosphate acyltransferase PlsY
VTFVFDHLLTRPCLWYVLISAICALLIGIFAIVMHKENIKRLLRGEEKKIHAKK